MSVDLAILALRIVLIGLVYLFLFQLLVVLWRDLRLASAQPKRQGRGSAKLVLLDPGQTRLSTSEVFSLVEINTLGRASTNSIVLDDDFVSAEHSLISYRGGQWWIEDLDTTNGTMVNRRLIDRPTLISPDDLIQIGRVQLALERT